ncbi:hypothetical protein Tco_1409212 [Tanacetum coccineum]
MIVYENSSNEIKKTLDALIIEDWVSDSEEDESEVMESDNVQQKPKQANQPEESVTTTVKTVNDREQQINVIVDGHEIAITEASIRSHLQLANTDCISTMPNTEIFEQLTVMGYVSTDDKLTFQKGTFSHPMGDFLIHTNFAFC